MPLLSTLGGGSVRGFGFATQKIDAGGFATLLMYSSGTVGGIGGASPYPAGRQIQFDSDNNIYASSYLNKVYATVGGTPNTEISGHGLLKIDGDPTSSTFGEVVSDLIIKDDSTTSGTANQLGFCVTGTSATPANNKIKTCAPRQASTAANTRNHVSLFQLDLNLTNASNIIGNAWGELNQYGPVNSAYDTLYGTNSGNWITFGYMDDGSTYDVIGPFYRKFNTTNGVTQNKWIKGQSNGSYYTNGIGAIYVHPSTETVTVVGEADGSSLTTNNGAYVFQFSSGGVENINKIVTLSYGSIQKLEAACAVTDSSDNVYVAAWGYNLISTSSDSDVVIFKMNSSGSLAWLKALDWDNNQGYPSGITLDSNNNLYVAIRQNETPTSFPQSNTWSQGAILKMDTSGNFGYLNRVHSPGRTSYDDYVFIGDQGGKEVINCDSDDNIVFMASSRIIDSSNPNNVTQGSTIFRIPAAKAQSGAWTGTYHGFIDVDSVSASLVTRTSSASVINSPLQFQNSFNNFQTESTFNYSLNTTLTFSTEDTELIY